MFIALDWISGKALVGDSRTFQGVLRASASTEKSKAISILMSSRCLLLTVARIPFEQQVSFKIPRIRGIQDREKFASHKNRIQKCVSQVHTIFARFASVRIVTYFATVLSCNNFLSPESRVKVAQIAHQDAISFDELHKRFQHDLQSHPRTVQQFKNKALEGENRFLRVAEYWVAPMHTSLREESWYLVTTLNTGFAIDSDSPVSILLRPLQTCHEKFWFAVPPNTVALVFRVTLTKPQPLFRITNQKPSSCERSL